MSRCWLKVAPTADLVVGAFEYGAVHETTGDFKVFDGFAAEPEFSGFKGVGAMQFKVGEKRWLVIV